MRIKHMCKYSCTFAQICASFDISRNCMAIPYCGPNWWTIYGCNVKSTLSFEFSWFKILKSLCPACPDAFCPGKNNLESWCQNVTGNPAFWSHYPAIHVCSDSLISPSDGCTALMTGGKSLIEIYLTSRIQL